MATLVNLGFILVILGYWMSYGINCLSLTRRGLTLVNLGFCKIGLIRSKEFGFFEKLKLNPFPWRKDGSPSLLLKIIICKNPSLCTANITLIAQGSVKLVNYAVFPVRKESIGMKNYHQKAMSNPPKKVKVAVVLFELRRATIHTPLLARIG